MQNFFTKRKEVIDKEFICLISAALMQAARAGDAGHAMLDQIAGHGFLDMTRFAASDYGIWHGILKTNQEAILEAVDCFSRSLSALNGGVPEEEKARIWEKAGQHRRKMVPGNVVRPGSAS